MPRYFLLLLLLMLSASSVTAQTGAVTGTVRDDTGVPLPGVNVVVAGTTRGAATSADGSYRIDDAPVGAQRIVASAIGFSREEQTVIISEGETVLADFVLAAVTLATDEVVITAARREQQLQTTPVSLSVLPAEALEERNIVSLDEALRYVSGVQMADNQVNIRGSSGFSYNTGSRVLLLLDGMSLLSPDSESISFETLPIAQIERIEVVKGPGSALYGSSALGGVINVITKDFPERPELDVRLFGGAYEPVRYAQWRRAWSEADTPRPMLGANLTYAHQRSERFGYWLNAAHRYDAGHLNFDEERSTDVYAKMAWKLSPPVRLTVLTGWTRRKADAFLYWSGLDDPLNPGNLGFADNTDADSPNGTNDNLTDRVTLHTGLTHVVTPTLFYSVRGRLFSALIRPLDENEQPRPVDAGTLGFRYGGEAQLNWSPREDRYLTAGLSGDALATQSSFFQRDDEPQVIRSQPEGGAFVQWEQAVAERLHLVAGLRYDFYQIDSGTTEQKLSPKLNASLSLTDHLALRGSFGQGFRVPSLAERFINNQSFFPIVLNLDLQPELSTGYEAGLRGAGSLRRFQVSADVAVFWTDYRRLVEPAFVAEERAFQFVNLIRARVRGAESELTLTSADGQRRLHLGYTFLDAEDPTTHEPLVFRSKHLFKAQFATHVFGPFSFGTDFRLASPFERVDTDFSRFVPDADVTSPIRVLDVRISATLGRGKLTMLARNLLDYYYVERPAILAPPRSFLLQASISL